MALEHKEIEKFFKKLKSDIPRPWLNEAAKQRQEDFNKANSVESMKTMVDYLEDNCQRFADSPAYSFMAKKLSYRQLLQQSRHVSAFLRHRLQLKPGSRVGMMLPNSLHFPVSFFGILCAGMTAVTINPLYRDEELKQQLLDADLSAIIVLEGCAQAISMVMEDVPIEHVIIARIGDFFPFLKRTIIHWVVKYKRKLIPAYTLPHAHYFFDVLQMKHSNDVEEKPSIKADHIALIQYTGGTSGKPKGVMLTHANLLSNAIQSHIMVKHLLGHEKPVVLGALPFYHIYSLLICSLSFMRQGANCLLIVDPRQQADLLNTFKKNKLTIFVGINTLFKSLLANKDFALINTHDWKLTITGGMAMEESVNKAWRTRTETQMIQGYGLSESSPVVTVNCNQQLSKINSIGTPTPGTDVCLLDVDKAKLCGIDEPGELCVKGPQVMKGYWQHEEKTKDTIVEDWLMTTDIAQMDADGYFYLVDRKKDMIIVSGFNVYPAEVEKVLQQHPHILEAGVIAIEDEHSGEAVQAFVVRTEQSLSTTDIIDFCKDKLAPYKVPKKISFRDSLPRSPIGKLLRRHLR